MTDMQAEPLFTMKKQTVTRTDFLVDIPSTGVSIELHDMVVEAARKQYHRDTGQLAPLGWLHIDVVDGKMRFFYVVRSDVE